MLLAHSPDIVLRLGDLPLDAPRPRLILSGHTHGGQVRPPLVGPVLTMSNLPRACATRLARFKLPKQFELVDDVPRGPTGKLLRRELR